MKADADVRQDVIGLQWDPQVSDPDVISVAVQDGAAPPASRRVAAGLHCVSYSASKAARA
jgi:hypothetical protein